MFSVHRKQTPFVVVGSLKSYENLHDLGWYGRRLCRDFPTVFLFEVGACADPGIFAGGGGGVQARLQNYSFQHIPWGGGGGGSIETHITYDFPGGSGPPTPLWIRAWGDCACAHAHLLSLR